MAYRKGILTGFDNIRLDVFEHGIDLFLHEVGRDMMNIIHP